MSEMENEKREERERKDRTRSEHLKKGRESTRVSFNQCILSASKVEKLLNFALALATVRNLDDGARERERRYLSPFSYCPLAN